MRLIYGIIMLLIGLGLGYGWAWGTHSLIRWGIAGICALLGAFGVFEARAGWCAVRAMGFKTIV